MKIEKFKLSINYYDNVYWVVESETDKIEFERERISRLWRHLNDLNFWPNYQQIFFLFEALLRKNFDEQ